MSAARKTIVITGCTRGLGRALTHYFIGEGAHVVGCGRSRAELQKLEDEFDSDHGFFEADIAVESDVADFAAWTLEKFGAPDLLINNAGVIAPVAPLWEVPAKEIARVLEVNVMGTIHMLRHFTPAMIQRGRGVIVNMSSGWGRSTDRGVAAYCASKWAIEGLTQSFAQELPEGLAAVAVNPGIIDTDMLRSCFGESAAHYPKAEAWVRKAGPFFLKLGPKQNGEALSVPGIPLD